jgi:hypothetical protein
VHEPIGKEENIMRYVLAMLLAVGMGVAIVVPAALAQNVNRYGNEVVPHTPGGNGGTICYVDGVTLSCTQPAPVTLYPASEVGTVAGGGVHDVSVDASRGMEGNNR